MVDGNEPLVCSTFTTPPDEVPLVEIKELLQYLLNVVNDFHLAVAALQETGSMSDALSAIQKLREVMTKQCREIEATYLVIDDSARNYSAIISDMGSSKARVEEHLGYITIRLDSMLRRFRKIDSGFTVGEQYFRQTAEKMASIGQNLGSGSTENDEARAFLLKSNNPKVVDSLLDVFSRIAKACQELADYYRKFKEHLSDMYDSLQSLQPPAEEVEAMARLWGEHSQHTARLKAEVSGLEMFMDTTKPYPLPSQAPYQSTSIAPPQFRRKTTTTSPPQSSPPLIKAAAQTPPPVSPNPDMVQSVVSPPPVTPATPASPPPIVNSPSAPPEITEPRDTPHVDPKPNPIVARLLRFSVFRRLLSCISSKPFFR